MASARASVEKMPISGLGHPTRSREMAVVDEAGALGLIDGVQAEDDPHSFAPVGRLRPQHPGAANTSTNVVRRSQLTCRRRAADLRTRQSSFMLRAPPDHELVIMLSRDGEAPPWPDARHASHDGLKGITGRIFGGRRLRAVPSTTASRPDHDGRNREGSLVRSDAVARVNSQSIVEDTPW